MNWQPIKKMFLQPDGSIDEIVITIATLVISGLVLEFRTYWNPPTGVVFSLKEFGEGCVGLAVAAGAWWKLRSMGDGQPSQKTAQQT